MARQQVATVRQVDGRRRMVKLFDVDGGHNGVVSMHGTMREARAHAAERARARGWCGPFNWSWSWGEGHRQRVYALCAAGWVDDEKRRKAVDAMFSAKGDAMFRTKGDE